MKYCTLMVNDNVKVTSCHRALMIGMSNLPGDQVNVYQTFVPPRLSDESATSFVFVTTSKDIHLHFGKFGSLTLWNVLCEFLEEQFENGVLSQIVLYRDNDRFKGWLVVRTESKETAPVITYTWSQVHTNRI